MLINEVLSIFLSFSLSLSLSLSAAGLDYLNILDMHDQSVVRWGYIMILLRVAVGCVPGVCHDFRVDFWWKGCVRIGVGAV